MKSDAFKAGLYTPPGGIAPAIPLKQILRIAELLKGVPPQFPPDFTSGTVTFRRNRPVLPPMERKPIF
jgi:hypothetical protein